MRNVLYVRYFNKKERKWYFNKKQNMTKGDSSVIYLNTELFRSEIVFFSI